MNPVTTPNRFNFCLIALIALSLVTASTRTLAQTQSMLQTELDSANRLLNELDEKALSCMGSFSINLGEAAALLCDEFLRAVDGELLASYIEHCRTLRLWKQETLEASAGNESEEQQKTLSDIEHSCAENSLRERTLYVFTAFNTLQQRTLLNQSAEKSIELRLDELEFQSRLDNQGQRLRRAIRSQGQQSLQSTQQQMQLLESELLRQQIDPPR